MRHGTKRSRSNSSERRRSPSTSSERHGRRRRSNSSDRHGGHRGRYAKHSDPQRRDNGHERRSSRSRSRSPHRRDMRQQRRSRSRSRSPRNTQGRYRSPRRQDVDHGRDSWRDGRRGGADRRGEGLSDRPPERYSIHKGKIVTIKPFGVFVAMEGYKRQGLVHHTQLSDDISFGHDDDDETKEKAMEFFHPVGSEVYVKVMEVREDGREFRLSCSMKAVDQNDGADLDPDNKMADSRAGGRGGGGRGPMSNEPPPLHAILQGRVVNVRPFGVFVELDGYRSWGLVHSSQVSDYLGISKDDSDENKVATLAEVAGVGERVWVKVVEVKQPESEGDRVKIGCSIKVVKQGDGTDLDPNNLQYRPRKPDGKGDGGPQERVAAVDGGKVDWGYLKGGDKKFGDPSRKYDYVSDGSPPHPRSSAQQPPTASQPLQPRGRGRAAVQPAWMSDIGLVAPGSSGMEEPPGITSVEDAVAILEKFGKIDKKKKHKKKDKKDKKDKSKKDKKKKHKKSSKSKSHKQEKQGTSSSSSGGSQ